MVCLTVALPIATPIAAKDAKPLAPVVTPPPEMNGIGWTWG
jgi:hypothetical protein